jgi:hypothetical protein
LNIPFAVDLMKASWSFSFAVIATWANDCGRFTVLSQPPVCPLLCWNAVAMPPSMSSVGELCISLAETKHFSHGRNTRTEVLPAGEAAHVGVILRSTRRHARIVQGYQECRPS